MTATLTTAPASPEPRRTRRTPRPVSTEMSRKLDDLRRCDYFGEGNFTLPTIPANSTEIASRHRQFAGGCN